MPGTDQGLREIEEAEETLAFWLDRKARLILRLLEGKSVIDIGCGVGSLTQFISQAGYETTALDTSQECLRRTKMKELRAEFVEGDICNSSSLGRRLGYFDSAVMSEVIEHLRDDELGLRNAFSLLKPNGVLIVTAPAFMFLYGQHDRNVGHQRRYTSQSLVHKLRSAGFIVEFWRYWNVPGMFGWLLASKLLRSSPNKFSFPRGSEMYDRWLGMEDHLSFPFGLTIVAKARKPNGRTT
jgi:2-polyprenyl-3-methyl-5-hydroxy-6-metoxy-1,4-benzoquinol methylase